MIITDKHISMIIESDVKTIVKPLFDSSEIDYFYYAEFFKSGDCFSLCSNAKWHKFFFDEELYKFNVDFPANGYHLCAVKAPIIAENAKNFGINHFFDYTKEYEDHYIMAGFGTSYGKESIIDFYLNNRDLLEKFIFYFQEQASTLIKISKKLENKIIMPEYYGNNNFQLKSNDCKVFDFLKRLNSSERPTVNLRSVLFSKRELECIKYILAGKNMREIAEQLFISPRTVETHIENMKNKFGCYKKSELIANLLENGFAQSFV